MHYATNRAAIRKNDPDDHYGSDRADMSYGQAHVSIPPNHHKGRLERPSIFRFQFSESPQNHIVICRIFEENQQQFYIGLKKNIDDTDKKSAFVFIHGYNITFSDAVRRIAQMAYDLFLTGHSQNRAVLSSVLILFSWPFKAERALYTHDETNIGESIHLLKLFLKNVTSYSGANELTVISHSMGSRNLATALNEIGLEMRTGESPIIKEIVLSAPDIDRDTFFNIANAVKQTGGRITIYTLRYDKALLFLK